ncbi:MAG: DUF2064 domain-containing protein, partial [Planctomycetes bacterium]|nr:DUF2064 domain-containing protein [Planctomycetota bacterium]
MRKNKLIIFTRYPEPGRTKTRLISALGAQGASDLHREMTEWTVRTARQAREPGLMDIEICYTGGDEKGMRDWLGANLGYSQQVGHDLGERMARAFRFGFNEGYERIVLVGTDCPELTVEIIERAFQAVEQYDVVIGPVHDGGYYLVGMTHLFPQLFTGIPWGTETVLQMTLDTIKSTGVSWTLLEKLGDVDTPEDLVVWEEAACTKPHEKPSISVIIPALNEADNLVNSMRSARQGDPLEIIVVDGGSDDSTVDIAKQFTDRVISCQRGRSRQMNAGAETAQGDYLLFLHADTVLPRGYERHVGDVLSEARNVCGAFQLWITGDFPGRRFVETMTAFRSRGLCMPYGDQALFVRRDDFF